MLVLSPVIHSSSFSLFPFSPLHHQWKKFNIIYYPLLLTGVMDKVVNLVLVYYNANATIALNVTKYVLYIFLLSSIRFCSAFILIFIASQDGYALWNPFRSVPRSVDTAYLMIDGIYSNPFSIQGLPSRGPGCVFIEVLQPPNGTCIVISPFFSLYLLHHF